MRSQQNLPHGSLLHIGWSLAGMVCAGIAFATALPMPIEAMSPARPPVAHTMRAAQPARRAGRTRGAATPSPCSTNYPGASFVGIAGQANVAGGEDSSVLGGYDNAACSEFGGIGAGYLNSVSGNGAFIGGGDDVAYSMGHPYGNSASGNDAFVGAGDVNSASGAGSFVGAGGVYYEGLGSGYFPGNSATGTDSFIGAGDLNSVDGQLAFLGSGYDNEVTSAANYGVIVGGSDNRINGAYGAIGGGSGADIEAQYGVIGGGENNRSYAAESAVVGGYANVVQGPGSFIGAGGTGAGPTPHYGNSNRGSDAFLGAGDGNTLSGLAGFIGAGQANTAAADQSFLGGGSYNSIAAAATYGVLVGGSRNVASGEYAAVLGGYANTASASYAVALGGDHNTAAGTLSFAAGYNADAAHNGSFVWSDYQSGSTALKDTAVNQFVVRASGGTTLYSNEAMTAGVSLAAGSGTWSSLSDRSAKTDIVPLDDNAVLAKVAALPISAWRYTSEAGVRHAGPMAQDFYAAFNLGEDDRHITSIDEDGVALAAIKALHADATRKDRQIAALSARVRDLSATSLRMNALENQVAALAAMVRRGPVSRGTVAPHPVR